MNNNDEVAKKMMDLVLDVYRYAGENNLDITSKEDIAKALTTIKPEGAETVDIDTLVEGLVAFDRMAKDAMAKRQKTENN